MSNAAVRSRRRRSDGEPASAVISRSLVTLIRGSFRTVARAETRLELLIKTVCYEVVVELGRNYLFQHL